MKSIFTFLLRRRPFLKPGIVALMLGTVFLAWPGAAAEPLRVFIRAGVKTHGPNQHDHPRFLNDWRKLLSDRGIKADGALEFPSAAQLENTDVLVIYAQDGMNIVGEQRAQFEAFLKRGGGLVVIHDGVVSADQHEWAKKVLGGAWRWDGDKKTKWYEGEVGVYFVDTSHPITRGLSNYDWQDEIYYQLDMAPDARVLATSFETVFIIAPQLWTYEKTWEGGREPYRAFVSLPGHQYDSFNTTHYRAILLRGIAWAGKRANVDEFCRPEEISEDALRYPVGGPTHPDQAASKLTLHSEFDLNLVASEPLIEKVISLDWAPDGKLWVAETPEYPGGRTINKNDAPVFPQRVAGPDNPSREGRSPRDRISWLEDSNGDGRMDKKHVFYEGLERVTSLVFYKDGVIVEQAPDILWLRDTDGDGKADKVETLYTGFGTSDTHAVINNMRWGYDGWIYSAIGYSAGNPKSGDGTRDFGRVTAGVIRFKPDGSALEQVASGSCNTWGLDFAPDGELFYTTATCGEHLLHLVMPEKVLARGTVGNIRASAVIPDHQKIATLVHPTRQAYLQIDWVGMFTAAAGCCFYNGGAWPESWNQNVFLHEPTVCLVHNDVLTRKGATFLARKEAGHEDAEFLAGSDLWFRPIHSRVGPDGALYVVDWYNQAVVHNDTRGPAHGAHNAATRPDRDHHFARIWRVQHKQAKHLATTSVAPDNSAALISALSSENGWLRMTAHRLLCERSGDAEAKALADLLRNTQAGPVPRMHALYCLSNLGRLDGTLLAQAVADPEPILRKNALRIVSERDPTTAPPEISLVTRLLNDPDARVQLNAFIALGTYLTPGLPNEYSGQAAKAAVAAWPRLQDSYLQSVAVGCAAGNPIRFIEESFGAADPAALRSLVEHVTGVVANRKDPDLTAELIIVLSRQPASGDALKQTSLMTLGARLRPDLKLAWNNTLQTAFRSLVQSSHANLTTAALPLIARWDTQGTMTAELKPLVAQLRNRLNDPALSDDERGPVVQALIGVRALDPQIVPAIASLLGSAASPGLQGKALEALGATREAATGPALVAAFGRVPTDLQEVVFGQVIKRADWSLALLEALANHKIDSRLIGPANLHRLRTHPDRAVSARANDVIDALRGPARKEKDGIIAQLKPIVEPGGGNVENGHKLFTANCTPCHIYKNEGRDLAPNLTGMGAHGRGDLLVHIVDPNRVVEPNFYSTSVETKDDLSYDGIIARENRAELVLRNASGDFTIRKDDIKDRRPTGLSLMPEGFEALGGEGLRDLISFLCADEQRFRVLNLSPAFTVNTGKGVYLNPDNTEDSPAFTRYGLVKVEDVPFDIISPQRVALNAVVLKGGEGFAKTLPQQVEFKVGLPGRRLHFLGGIGAWAWPWGGESEKDMPVFKVVLHFAGGGSEEMVFRNGVEFADWIAPHDVPGSKGLPTLAKRGQIRMFSKEVQNHAVIESITLSSYDNHIAPTLIALSVELPGISAASPGVPAKEIRTLIVGAGTSHDFQKWFLDADARTLRALAGTQVTTAAIPDEVEEYLNQLDVLCLCNNAPFTQAATRERLLGFANAGKGLVLIHPALWYNWADWPEYNRLLCGGGSRGHDHYAEFEVTVTDPGHPLMQGVPPKFTVKDELYWFEPDPQGTPIKVLATAYSPSKKKNFPMIFVVEHPKTRIAGIALGHDGEVHDSAAYQRLLRNALVWTAQK